MTGIMKFFGNNLVLDDNTNIVKNGSQENIITFLAEYSFRNQLCQNSDSR
jgi:hypothetical protein